MQIIGEYAMGEHGYDYFDHPVFHPTILRIATPAMENLRNNLLRLLWTGATGGYITGAPRVGKTTALLNLQDKLYTRGKITVPVYYVSMPGRDQRTITSVFRQLCQSVELRNNVRDRADHLSDRFVHYIIDRAIETNCQTAVLLIDEMQRLHPSQINAFAEVYDKLRLFDISLTVILIGNDQESKKLLKKISEPEYSHIHGRFFTQGWSFLGLTSKNDVKMCLSQYDTLCFPENGQSYAKFFLSDAVESGWCYASLSDDIWRVFREYQINYNIPSWGMQYFLSTVNTLLTDYLSVHGVSKFDDAMVHECIQISGLIPSLVRVAS